MTQVPWYNSRTMLMDMDRLGIGMAGVTQVFNMRNEMIQAQVRKFPGRFIGFCNMVATQREAWLGRRPFDIGRACRELDYWLSKPEFVGVGEMVSIFPDPDIHKSVDEQIRLMFDIMEVRAHHDNAPILIRTGCFAYLTMCRLRACDPVLIDDLAVRYPDVPIIVGHMGTTTSHWSTHLDVAMMLASRHPNVHLETCQATRAQIETAYIDTHIGPSKMVFGSDYGASISYRRVEGEVRSVTVSNEPPKTLQMHQDFALRQIRQIEMPENERAMILGLNMARLCRIDLNVLLKRIQEERYGSAIAVQETQDEWPPDEPDARQVAR